MTAALATEVAWSDGRVEPATFNCSNQSPWRLSLSLSSGAELSEEAADLFECLINLRTRLAEQGAVILCAGARKNVFPSSMARDMGGGRLAYRLTLGQQAKRDDLIDILASVSADQIADVGEQRAFYDQWLASLRQD